MCAKELGQSLDGVGYSNFHAHCIHRASVERSAICDRSGGCLDGNMLLLALSEGMKFFAIADVLFTHAIDGNYGYG